MNNVTLQYELRPAIPNIYGHYDYRQFRDTLSKIDEILIKGDLENKLVDMALENWAIQNNKDEEFCSSKLYQARWRKMRYAMRCNIARHLTGESYRHFSIRLADSELFQWFVGISDYEKRKGISKSTLERYSKYFDQDILEKVIHEWQSKFLSGTQSIAKIGLKKAIDFEEIFMDSTCVKANIHYPVDWLLLRDASRSLLSAIKTVRSKGLKHRMIEPSLLMRQMNTLSIEMTHARRRKDSKKNRKIILRKMKKLNQCIKKHGVRYKNMLELNWQKTDWSEAEENQVISRIDNILTQLPAAIKQAHDRIIGERKIAANKKILSLYEKDVHVIVRGKSNNEVEFGQGLLLTEQTDGLIIDWKLFKDQPPADSRLLDETLNRIEKNYGLISSACADRGFYSKANENILDQHKIYNSICPKNPKQLQEYAKDPRFLTLQRRRGQTEARIGIFKNAFLGKPLRSKGFLHRELSVTWCVLTHNLWVIARKALADEQSLKKAA